MGDLEQLLLREWDRWNLGRPRPHALAFLQISSTWLGDSGRVVFLGFAKGDKAPCVAARIVRSEAYRDILVNEHASLAAIHATSPLLRGSVPRPLFCGMIGGRTVRIETALPGVPLSTLAARSSGGARRRIVERGYARLGKWLRLFRAVPTQAAPTWGFAALEARFLSSIADYTRHFDPQPGEMSYLRWLRTSITALRHLALPIVPNHGDLAANAILVTAHGLGVMDWEYYTPTGVPLYDHLMAVIQNGFSIGSSSGSLTLLNQFRVFFGPNWYSQMASEWLRAACVEVGLPVSLLSLWLPLFLVELSNSRDWDQQVPDRNGEGSWRNLLAFYIENHAQCWLTGEGGQWQRRN